MDIKIFSDKEHEKKLMQFIEAYQPGHDDTQIRHFIIDKNGVTDYGKYKQCLAEIYSHYSALQDCYFRKKTAAAKIDLYLAEKEELPKTPVGEARSVLIDIKIEEKRMLLHNIQKSESRSLRELNILFTLCMEYEQKITDSGQTVEDMEHDFWVQKLAKDIDIQRIYNGGNLSGVMETILSLPEEPRHLLVNHLRGVHDENRNEIDK